MSDENKSVSRRNVLKKSAAAATVATTGLAVTSGSATAADPHLLVQGQGSYHIQLYADNVEVTDDGVSLEPVESVDANEGTLWDLEGEVNGEINSTPDDYAQFKITGFDGFAGKLWDDGVDVYYAGDEVQE